VAGIWPSCLGYDQGLLSRSTILRSSMLKSYNRIKKGGLLLTAVLILTLLTVNIGVCAVSPKRVAVFPFTMNSPQDLGFLQNGLFSMLSSRLADPGKVDVLDREAVDTALAQAAAADATKGALNESKARIIGASLGVDYILFGSLTHFGESVSLDASMVDVTGTQKTLSFFEQSNAMGDVIPLVNAFAGDINLKVFNRNISNDLYAQPVPQAPAAPGALQHAGGGMMALQQGGGQGFATRLSFDGIITAMAIGDLNNDGVQQVVAATDSNLMLYSLKGTVLNLEQTLEYDSYLRIISLDVADINGNGYPEIFVSATTVHRENLASFVVEYNGSSYATLMDNESEYYRVMTTRENTKVLMAQDRGMDPFSGRIHVMTAKGNTYSKEKRIRTPRGASVLSMSQGPVTDENMFQSVYINEHNRLVVVSDSGSLEWESSNKYGLTNNVWFMPKTSVSDTQEKKYYHPRTLFYDLGQDGTKKVIVVKNNEAGGGTFGQYKRFTEGHIEVMAWNGIALAPVFQTQPVQGWISDYAFADLDGDGEKELVVSVVTRTKLAIFSKDKASNIISYDLK
jgi:TolB-like protein